MALGILSLFGDICEDTRFSSSCGGKIRQGKGYKVSTKEKISSAIVAHRDWKIALRVAINTGRSDLTPDEAAKNNKCAFGHWLHHDILPQDKGEQYNDIVHLHSRFHQEAGHILEVALQGEKAEAKALLDQGDGFRMLTDDLIKKLRRWEQAL